VSQDRYLAGPQPEECPPKAAVAGQLTPGLSLVVGRHIGMVVVTVTGDLDHAGCQVLEAVLTDLIEGQGNLTVAVDLGKATIEPEALWVFIVAAGQARRRGATLVLQGAPANTQAALQAQGYGDLVEVLPRTPTPSRA